MRLSAPVGMAYVRVKNTLKEGKPLYISSLGTLTEHNSLACAFGTTEAGRLATLAMHLDPAIKAELVVVVHVDLDEKTKGGRNDASR